MKDDQKKNIPFFGQNYGLNVLVNPKKLNDGEFPWTQNWFPDEIGTLAKRKGIKYLIPDLSSPGNPKWKTSDTPCSQNTTLCTYDIGTTWVPFDATTPNFLTTSAVRRVPISNVGIDCIKSIHYYNRPVTDEGFFDTFLMVAGTKAASITDIQSVQFSIDKVVDGLGEFDYNNTQSFKVSLWAKTAAGYVFANSSSIANFGATSSLKINIGTAPANVQYWIITISYTNNSAQVTTSKPVMCIPANISFAQDIYLRDDEILTYSVSGVAHAYLGSAIVLPGNDWFAYPGYSNLTDKIYGDIPASGKYCGNGGDAVYYHHIGNPIQTHLPMLYDQRYYELAGNAKKEPSGTVFAWMFMSMPMHDNTKGNDYTYISPASQTNYDFQELYDTVYLPTTAGIQSRRVGGTYTGLNKPDEVFSSNTAVGIDRMMHGSWLRFPYFKLTDTDQQLYTRYMIGSNLMYGGDGSDKAQVSGPPRAKYSTIYRDRLIVTGNQYSKNKVYHGMVSAGSPYGDFTYPTSGVTYSKNFDLSNQISTSSQEDDGFTGENNGLDIIARTEITNSVDTLLVIFRPRAIFVIKGDWKDHDSNYTEDLTMRTLSRSLGLAYERGKAHTPNGLIFRSQEGIYVVNPDGVPTSVGDKINPIVLDKTTYVKNDSTRALDTTFVYHENVLRVMFGLTNVDYVDSEAVHEQFHIQDEVWFDMRAWDQAAWWGPHKVTYPTTLKRSFLPNKLISKCRPRSLSVTGFSEPFIYSGSSDGNLLIHDQGYQDLGQTINSELISPEYDFGFPGLLKAFRAIGTTIDAENTSKIHILITTDQGRDDYGSMEVIRNNVGNFDEDLFDQIYWAGKYYGYKKIILTQRPLGRSARVRIIHNENSRIKITDLELFFKITKRSYL